MRTPAVARGTRDGFPASFAEIVDSPAGAAAAHAAVAAACAPALCPAAAPLPGGCAGCQALARDLELQALRWAPPPERRGAFAAELVDGLCASQRWRHADGDKAAAQCGDLVDAHDSALAAAAEAAMVRGAPSSSGDGGAATVCGACKKKKKLKSAAVDH